MVIFIATVGSTGLKRSLLIGLIAAVLYFGFYLRNNPFSSLLTFYMLLRVPFFFPLAFLSTYNSEQLKSEVTRRLRAEEKTERVLEQHKVLVHTIPDIIYELDAQGRFTFLSDSIRQLGFTAGELLGKHFSAIIHPQDRELVRRDVVLEKHKGDGGSDVPPPKLFDERRTGSRMTKNLGLRLILNQPQTIEQPFIYAEVHSSGKWASDETGREKTLLGTIGIIRDITESYYDKKAIQEKNEALEAMNTDLTAALQKTEKANEELKQAESQLLQSEKLAAIGQMAAGIAHEINNPLGYVSSNIGVLNTHLEQLTQMLNAVQALDGKGVITIRTHAEDHRAIVEIADTGQGIPPDKLDKIFEPFVTSKPAGKGTGLGLSISLDIVRRHGGTIEVESALGKDTTFRITLPC